MNRDWYNPLMEVVARIGDISSLSPSDIEWTVVDQLIALFFEILMCWRRVYGYSDTFTCLFEFIIRYITSTLAMQK